MGREKTNLTLHPAVKRQAQIIAETEGRSLSEVVERLLEAWVKEEEFKSSVHANTKPKTKAPR